MRRFYHFYLFLFISLVLFSCKPDKSNVIPASQQLLGKWTLQQQQYKQYVDGIKQKDTTLNASEYSRAYLEFKSNGTFNSAGFYSAGNTGNLGSGIIAASDSTNGTFSFSGSAFTLSAPIAGFASDMAVVGYSSGSIPVIRPVSNSVSNSQLTSSSLKIHTEYIYTYTINNLSQTYKMDDDYFYTK
jgi:hypothetical protein